MDMKKLLQVMDDVSSTPVENVSDMKKILNIINEGANPHKVSLPVQMAMQHYTPLSEEPTKKHSLLKKYLQEVEEVLAHEKTEKRQVINQHARLIAERVRIKEGTIPGHNIGFKGGAGPGLQSNEPSENIENPKDIVKMDIPLLIRLLEYAREDAKTDMDLHNVTTKLIDLSSQGDVLTMDQYDVIVGEQELLPAPTNEECWKGYQQLGMKKKGNKSVPNCVPKEKK